MTSSLSSTGRNNYVSNVSGSGKKATEDDFGRNLLTSTKNRSNRASSLALPNYSLISLLDKEQNVLYDTLNLTPPATANGRRHSSSSHYFTAEIEHHHRTPSPPVVINQTISTTSIITCGNSSSGSTNSTTSTVIASSGKNIKGGLNNAPKKQRPDPLPLVPPPVPKRTFPSKYHPRHQRSPRETMNYTNPSYEPTSANGASYTQYLTSKAYGYPRSPYGTDISPGSTYSTKVQHHSLSDFDDIGDTDDLVLYDKKTYVDSNKSSSDSNRSHVTIDTGYMSANETERSSVYTANTSAPRSFRSRFSSEDTQCSLDSFTSTELQRTDTTDSITNYNDSPFSTTKKNVFTFDRRFYERSSSAQSEASDSPGPMGQSRRLPALPARKAQKQMARNRSMPPTPPIRPSLTAEGKLLQNGQTLQGFQEQINNAKAALEEGSEPPNFMVREHNPSLRKIHGSKLNQRQDSSLSNDSYSLTSSPGYSTKSTMEIPLLQHGSKISRTDTPLTEAHLRQQQQDTDNGDNLGPIISAKSMKKKKSVPPKVNIRQDSSISSDSFSQTSSPSYNSKQLMETPLLANAAKLNTIKPNFKNINEIEKAKDETDSNGAIIKSASTPASLQTIVRLSNGSTNMSLQHKILKKRKNSNPYITRGRLKFRFWQIFINIIAIIAILAGMGAYFTKYPIIKYINNTVIKTQQEALPTPFIATTTTTVVPKIEDNPNPAPGVCLPVIVKFCQNYKIPYNYTVFPNYIGHFGQLEAQAALELFDALVDVQCYELVPLYLCTLFVPKCGTSGAPVPPCRSLCNETMRRCGFFFGVFGLELPDYLTCKIFGESDDPEECIGRKEMQEAKIRQDHPQCSGFLCDTDLRDHKSGKPLIKCIPNDWKCDGHVDCVDQSDESACGRCGNDTIHCGDTRCMSRLHVCNGIIDCPWGQDERNCVRLSGQNGDMGRGVLEVYKPSASNNDKGEWKPACVRNWDSKTSPTLICSMLGYRSVNSSNMTMRISNRPIMPPKQDASKVMRMIQRRQSNLLKEFTSCTSEHDYPVVQLTCTNYECGKIRNKFYNRPTKRIIGGKRSNPGDWPFLAAILGGPEKVFYCAGVLIADQWVLTASHCIGNHTLRDVKDWTIQLGITRRHTHSYYGQEVGVRMAIPHPQYDAYIAHDNDIALFQLVSRVAFHEHLLPVCLPPRNMPEIMAGTNCTVIGWGKREDKSSGTPHTVSNSYEATVNEVTVPVLPRDLCNEWLDMLNVTDGMICAGYSEGGKDACQGDSGGPLLCPYPGEKDRWFVGGIVSWGIMCAHPRLPGVYANVPKYVPWILTQMHKYSVSTTDILHL
ncbi:uncharacterized protein LOC134828792 [Culicoides brevitarsis]|uniref:uncharacterized protein LOC134828792 n=1 Tax=Culicoides brevitarsis TaxID=469753 RepID=UPI00307C44C6